MLAEANSKLYWFMARSSGLVAWALCTASILWGLALSTRLIRRRGAPAWLLDLHRFLGLLSIVFTAVHLLALNLHARWEFKEFPFGLRELFVPMASRYRPGWIAWGIVAFYLMVAVQVTSWLMRWIRRKIWHTIHLSSFALFIGATLHGLKAGTDRGNALIQWGAHRLRADRLPCRVPLVGAEEGAACRGTSQARSGGARHGDALNCELSRSLAAIGEAATRCRGERAAGHRARRSPAASWSVR
jgi:Ferric reductase like transmembrane component